MTAGKNQAQPVVFKGVTLKAVLCVEALCRSRLRFEITHELILRGIKSCPSTQSINGFESGRRNQPWSRVAGHATGRPQAQGSRKGFVHRLLGKIKITQQADQSCQDSSGIHAIKGVEQFAYLVAFVLGETLGHDDDLSKPATPNQFGKWRIDAKCTEAEVAGSKKDSQAAIFECLEKPTLRREGRVRVSPIFQAAHVRPPGKQQRWFATPAVLCAIRRGGL